MASPGITLHVDLKDLSGAEIGTVADPAAVRIGLAGFGSAIPRIIGTALVARTGPYIFQYTGTALNITLWGNDQISPSWTYYDIAVIDGQGNVIQADAYIFTGTTTVDLSTAAPIIPPVPPFSGSNYIIVPWASTIVFSSLIAFPITIFDLTMTGDVSASSLGSFAPASLVQFFISQDGVGGHAFAWPSNVKNPPLVDPAANSTLTALFVMRTDGNLYPVGPAWS